LVLCPRKKKRKVDAYALTFDLDPYNILTDVQSPANYGHEDSPHLVLPLAGRNQQYAAAVSRRVGAACSYHHSIHSLRNFVLHYIHSNKLMYYWHRPRRLRQGQCNDTVSVRLSVCLSVPYCAAAAGCGGFAAVGPADR